MATPEDTTNMNFDDLDSAIDELITASKNSNKRTKSKKFAPKSVPEAQRAVEAELEGLMSHPLLPAWPGGYPGMDRVAVGPLRQLHASLERILSDDITLPTVEDDGPEFQKLELSLRDFVASVVPKHSFLKQSTNEEAVDAPAKETEGLRRSRRLAAQRPLDYAAGQTDETTLFVLDEEDEEGARTSGQQRDGEKNKDDGDEKEAGDGDEAEAGDP
ncbi:hypothetical protein M409DRAFT_18255 [Zasmidium cellare ATCC 36951]|uniref:Uncharacterized protein n=1 Tax=Zasmidium cellare ATCC 36951 TaxID=1080233 RepID=A0A6A6D2Z4_ZASCE|nr:uncharacterized protein M409DRAFT_18255 [Zasmidium cellare ATCC 36951]KAF2172026.1 hypothetical protein M409DRAFT_18255 [Zasmidium cellare ATCC 36951]